MTEGDAMKITLVGIGMGNIETLTVGAYRAIEGADCIIGASRMTASLPKSATTNIIHEILPNKIKMAIDSQTECKNICVLFSGDIGFYSGAKKLIDALGGYDIETISGVSSVQYFASKLNKTWQAWKLVSAHGVSCEVVGYVQNNREVFFLTGGEILAHDICKKLAIAGFKDAQITVGENLSYHNERVSRGTAAELSQQMFAPLSVVLVESNNISAYEFATSGLDDDLFVRGASPMTKQEIRAVSLAKLRVQPSDVCYDIGAGTGSVTVELGLLAKFGHVFAVESQLEACEIIAKNIMKFGLHNVSVFNNTAPDGTGELPPPNAVFIGGSKGNLLEILEVVKHKNKNVRVVINAITLETLAQATDALRQLKFGKIDILQIAANRAKKMGNYNMLMAQNPVFIISAEGSADE